MYNAVASIAFILRIYGAFAGLVCANFIVWYSAPEFRVHTFWPPLTFFGAHGTGQMVTFISVISILPGRTGARLFALEPATNSCA